MNRILIIGNFGVDGQLNGQSARTRTVAETVKKIYNKKYKVVEIDTKKYSVKDFIRFFLCAVVAKKIIILPAQKSLKPIVFGLSKIMALRKTTYVVIGGWLDRVVEDDKKLARRLKQMNCLLVQVDSLKGYLSNKHIRCEKLNNYRIYERPLRFLEKSKKIVFYSRVRKDKGVEIAIESVNDINKNRNENERIILDIYGPIDENYRKDFKKIISNNEHIKYMGILNGNERIIEALSQYQILLFPTYYDGEGYPGAILEAISAGVPVIASDWRYNREIVLGDRSGLLVKAKSRQDLEDKILLLYDDKKKLADFERNCRMASEKYSEENAITVLKKVLGQ